MPGVPGHDRSREGEVAAALEELRAANLRGAGGVSDAAWRAVIEDYFCVGSSDQDEDELDLSVMDTSSDIETSDDELDSEDMEVEETDELRHPRPPIGVELPQPKVPPPCKETTAVQDFSCPCNCKALFAVNEIVNYRYSILELTRTEKDLVVMAQLHALTNSDATTACTKKKHQRDREHSRSTYYFRSKQICREFFKLCHR